VPSRVSCKGGADTAAGQGRVRPLLEGGADARALADKAIDIRLLPRRGLRLARGRCKEARGDARVPEELLTGRLQ
jgi:hypothetical protein